MTGGEALSMDMFCNVGMFMFCTRRCTRVRLNARDVGDAFRNSTALSLDELVSTYYTSSHPSMYCSFSTLRLFVKIYWRRFSWIISGSPSTFSSGDGYPTLVPTSRRAYIIFLSTLLVPGRLQQHRSFLEKYLVL